MATTSQFIDGSNKLDQQQDTLNFMEQITASKVITYGKSSQQLPGAHNVNEAVLLPAPFGQQPPPLELASATSDSDVAKIITDHLAKGKTVIFHEKGWVEDKETTVLGFR